MIGPTSYIVISFEVVGCPTDNLALTNRLIVNPYDFPSGAHVLLKGEFALTVQ